jgi:ubiquinone/menaquinone biosynthesis C-methylase UbiE
LRIDLDALSLSQFGTISGSVETEQGMMASIPSYRSPDAARDRIIALCGSVEGSHVLDVGSGDGWIGRALLPTIGSSGTVTFLDHDPVVIQELAADLDRADRARAMVDDACTLGAIAGESIDLVVMRAVLLYIPDKSAALRSAARVLRPNGRIVVSEPVNRPLYHPPERFWGFDLSAIPVIAAKVQRGFTEHAEATVRAMSSWDDLDLATHVADAGFVNIKMETITEISAGPVIPWLAFLYSSWTPWMPSLADVARRCLSAEERQTFERIVRPQLTGGRQRLIVRNTFVTARSSKP